MSLQRTLLTLIILAVLAGTAPAGAFLDRWVANTLEAHARDDLSAAPHLLADRNAAVAEAMAMHAKDLANTPGLATAFAHNDREAALTILASGPTAGASEGALLIGPNGSAWAGMSPTPAFIDSTRRGHDPVAVLADGPALRAVAMAPVFTHSRWVGAAGVTRPYDRATAETLAGLTRSDVILVAPNKSVAASTMPDTIATRIASTVTREPLVDSVHEAVVDRAHYLVATAPVGPGTMAIFVRDLGKELALIPRLRHMLVGSGLVALLIALLLGAFLAARVTAPVKNLVDAAGRLAAGDFDAPLGTSKVIEVRRLAQAFGEMRQALATRLAEVESANVALAERSARLSMVQAELMQQDRLAATGHLVVQLAHEIRNPVANIRNCLELIRRKVEHDEQARGFADLAVEELMRMHALAEQLLDLNRPRAAEGAVCEPGAVVREVVTLIALDSAAQVAITDTSHRGQAAIGADALKQVLLNLTRNAIEAAGGAACQLTFDVQATPHGNMSTTTIDVIDNGPGIPESLLPQIFDPFVTTKRAVHGVGLGLFVAEGLVRSAGGRISAWNRTSGTGAIFRVELPGPYAAS